MFRKKYRHHHIRLLTLAGGLSGFLSIIGALNLCCVTPAIALLGIFGGLSAALAGFSWMFLFLSVMSFGLAWYMYHKTPKKCS